MANKKSFEDNLATLQEIVDQLQKGDVPLEQAMTKFQTGMQLIQELDQTLKQAEQKLTKVMDTNGQESDFQLDSSSKDEA
ncbi:exodeoxyribonuclease VII small subunit [Lactobacillus sp. DCY120]|uniref:Exodeoxyribonuclease 7 small subunit n=1 Tax=Bombilactobacillus apium TaxID=2675299 RepID=A0A850RCC5_9LACO|nr:exodeoxyribonuclease VII small subunit [Bombilactobacillus apium]NVY96956.1 exodeoxyribonuclease VII small subunit [Bombilactobacillus apium]